MMNDIYQVNRLVANTKKYRGCKKNSYKDPKEAIIIEPVSAKELHNILPIGYEKHLGDIRAYSIIDIFEMVDKAFKEHKMDSKIIRLYFYGNKRWYKIVLKEFINRNETEVLDFYKGKIAFYFLHPLWS